jgi:hypothetical protein
MATLRSVMRGVRTVIDICGHFWSRSPKWSQDLPDFKFKIDANSNI